MSTRRAGLPNQALLFVQSYSQTTRQERGPTAHARLFWTPLRVGKVVRRGKEQTRRSSRERQQSEAALNHARTAQRADLFFSARFAQALRHSQRAAEKKKRKKPKKTGENQKKRKNSFDKSLSSARRERSPPARQRWPSARFSDSGRTLHLPSFAAMSGSTAQLMLPPPPHSASFDHMIQLCCGGGARAGVKLAVKRIRQPRPS